MGVKSKTPGKYVCCEECDRLLLCCFAGSSFVLYKIVCDSFDACNQTRLRSDVKREAAGLDILILLLLYGYGTVLA